MSKAKSSGKREKSSAPRGAMKRIKQITAEALAEKDVAVARLEASHETADAAVAKKSDATGKVLDFPDRASVDSPQTETTVESTHDASFKSQEQKMDITLTRSTRERKSTGVVYNAQGYPGGVRVPKSWFADGNIPDSIVVSSDVFRDASQPRRKLTKEERAALPKPTAAEKLQRAEARLAKLRAKVAQEQAAQL